MMNSTSPEVRDFVDLKEQPTPVPKLIEAQAARTPGNPAVLFGDEVLSYFDLNARANQLARYLIKRGVAPEQFIAVALAFSPEMVVAFLGVLKAGAAYLPIDLNYPADRTALMLADARPRYLLTTSEFGRLLLADSVAPTSLIMLDDHSTVDDIRGLPAADPVDADRAGPQSMLSPMYLIYTSGSTGKPKGVVVEHRAGADYLTWTGRSYRGTRGVAIVPTSAAFDLTVTGLYTPLTVGGQVRLLRLDAYGPQDTHPLRTSPCTFLKVTPSHLPLLATMPEGVIPNGELLLGGEALSGEMIESLRHRHPGTTVINAYGPTEATVNCAEYRIAPGTAVAQGAIPIGRAHANTQLHVLDTRLRPMPDAQTGELYIAGARLARGYFGQPGATAQKFVADPFGPPGGRMYRTGDLVLRGEDGMFVFVGRADSQVKLHGHRVELTEIESELARHPRVAQAACTVRETQKGKRLIAYVTMRAGSPVSASAVRKYARDRLPRHMVPATVVIVDALPLTANSKLDRKTLAQYSPQLTKNGPERG
jgi:amino acid adenylation domain-containing protein